MHNKLSFKHQQSVLNIIPPFCGSKKYLVNISLEEIELSKQHLHIYIHPRAVRRENRVVSSKTGYQEVSELQRGRPFEGLAGCGAARGF